MASRKKGISVGPTCPAQSLASTRKYHGWSSEGYDRYNVLYQRVKIDHRDLGASFDFHVKIYGVFLMIDKKWLDWSIEGEFVQVYLQVHLHSTC